MFSDQKANCSKSGGSGHNWESVSTSLSLGQESHIVDIFIGLVSRIHIVGQECLEEIVEFIGVHSLESLGESGVHPVGVRSTMSKSIVINDPESVSECLSIYEWVQGIS